MEAVIALPNSTFDAGNSTTVTPTATNVGVVSLKRAARWFGIREGIHLSTVT
jgi:hypothetical protein